MAVLSWRARSTDVKRLLSDAGLQEDAYEALGRTGQHRAYSDAILDELFRIFSEAVERTSQTEEPR